MKKKLDSKDLGKYGLMFYNSVFMLAPSVILATYTGDMEKVNITQNSLLMLDSM